MSGNNIEDVKEKELTDKTLNNQDGGDSSLDELKALDKSDENLMPSPQQEEEIIKKKYGGLLPKKPPLISKDHERAFFDSADWALGKEAQKPKGPLEALRPKLQPTPHQQVRSRRSAYAPADDGGEVDDGNNNTISSEDHGSTFDGGDNNNYIYDGGNNKSTDSKDQICPE
ncbi:hypothetical protein F2P56_030039 [Juglans regia]|uniref:Uncharacterized protein LOC108979405 isoform X1 n=2 Tax=Juglans regia TaxID=51240 RepID=A0A6P9EAQ9_JUGRE|nr:uncharacterized protein LOC108979405 isoform X1 [Juglans regia]XP_035539868.1 uncharacterized protein LOC108979405 isoform X1 [Juglans regia]KAF5449610.1 hypothetical protein F2P56_030038 [Juglans regia]KAF5449611.1 hypothetical protein F2P56_030039 [Juglans regia]